MNWYFKKKKLYNYSLLFFLFYIFNIDAQSASKDDSKWVVITSIYYPTEAIKKLAQLGDWHVVIVGDKKTPKDWSFPNCEYLGIEKQLALGYRTTTVHYQRSNRVPWNHYCRKNIGYLYAIQHGATTIYDTDDDNILAQDNVVYFPPKKDVLVYNSASPIANPYDYFGQPTVWPRGYPLDQIMISQNYTFNKQTIYPLIQQGLADEDPDVDAIFRLTRPLDILFKKNIEPIAFAKGIMCPFNSQNTIFHYNAFWGLLIPMTTTFRVCDIWRGYWITRLLWDIGGNVCFMPPTVIQKRNAHNYLHDFKDELNLYLDAGKLINYLISWKSTKLTLEERMTELMEELMKREFFSYQELELLQAWIRDLKEVGYKFPSLIN